MIREMNEVDSILIIEIRSHLQCQILVIFFLLLVIFKKHVLALNFQNCS